MTMRTKTKPILLLTVAVVGALALARYWTHDGDDAADPTLVFDRVWLDELPRTPKQTFNTFVAATEEPFGLFHAGSQWKGTYEISPTRRAATGYASSTCIVTKPKR